MRKHNTHRKRLDRVSNQSNYLTPGELTAARLRLSQEMVHLVLRERDTLPVPLLQALERLAARLDAVMQQARELP